MAIGILSHTFSRTAQVISANVASASALYIFSALSIAGALYLSLISVIALFGLGVWVLAEMGAVWLAMLKTRKRFAWLLAGTALVSLAVFAVYSGLFSQLIDLFRGKDVSLVTRQDPRFYHWLFMNQYPTLWTLLPLAIISGLARYPRLTGFCATIFSVSFVLLTMAEPKGERYIYFAMPFLFVLWSVALAEAVPRVGALTTAAVKRLWSFDPRHLVSRVTTGIIYSAVAVFLVLGNSGRLPAKRDGRRAAVRLSPKTSLNQLTTIV